MEQKEHLMHSNLRQVIHAISVALMATFLVACAGTKTIELEVVEEDPVTIARVEPQKPLELADVKWYVVTHETIDEVHAKIERTQGSLVYYAIIPKGYENLALNLEEVRTYMNGLQAAIDYYEAYLYAEEAKVENE